MVKDSKTKSGPRRGPMSPLNADGSQRGKPGPEPRPADAKTDRIIMRVHPDLLKIIDARAREKDLTRSKYLSQVLVGWANADPRNSRLDAAGRCIEPAPHRYYFQRKSPLRFAQRWLDFVRAHTVVLGHPPPVGWVEELDNEDDPAARPSK